MAPVRAVPLDERAFAEALDRESPGLLALALAFADDATTAHRLVEEGWLRALRSGRLDDPAGSVRVAVVRAMADVGTSTGSQDAALVAAGRALRLAVRASGVLDLPVQRDRRAVAAPGTVLPSVLHPADLRRLVPPLRLVLLLTDVQRWSHEEVVELLEVRPQAHRAILGHARRALLTAVPRTASA